MEVVKKAKMDESDFQSIYRIWNSVYPSQVSFSESSGFEEYLLKAGSPTHYCVFIGGALIGWLMTFDRENKRWFTILVSQDHHGVGVGGELLKKLKEDETSINGWILEGDHYKTLSGEKYRSPRSFYLINGFRVTNENQESRGMKFTKIYWELGKT